MMEFCDAAKSKPLGHDDLSGFLFAQEMLKKDKTAAINFDRLQKHPVKGYILFEYLLCDEKQTVTPYTSHPRRYWHKNKTKFLGLWRVARALNAELYLVNYAKRDTKHENEVLVIQVLDMNEDGITEEKIAKTTRARFSEWFRKLNAECMASSHELMVDLNHDLCHMSAAEIGKLTLEFGKYKGKQIKEIAKLPNQEEYSYILRAYFEKSKGCE